MSAEAPARKQSSICLVVCYTGEFPEYFDCVLRSCAENPTVDWLIFGDRPAPCALPPNVRLQSTSIGALSSLFSAKLGFNLPLLKPRQFCNLKPAYGYFFEEYLQGYDFWGHCDFDMIFGDLRKYFTEDVLGNYNKLLNRGHLALYRNTPEVNQYFTFQSPGGMDYRKAFLDPEVNTFDEWSGVYANLRYHGIPQYHAEFILDIVPPTKWHYTRFEGTAIRNYPFQFFYWYKGKVFQAFLNCDGGTVDEEYAYLHFGRRKLPAPQFNLLEFPGFLITPEGFFPYARECFRKEDYLNYNRTRLRPYRELLQWGVRSLKWRLGIR